jgi:hypothetical protein
MQEKFLPYMDEKEISMIIFDGELLPWMALGKGLIEKQFEVIGRSLETEITFLKEFGFEEKLQELGGRYEESRFEELKSKYPKKELIKNFGLANYNNFKDLKGILETLPSLDEQEQAAAVYQQQLDLYAKDSELEYKPFSILKMVYDNGEEEIPALTAMRTSEIFSLISEDEFLVVNLELGDSYVAAQKFFEKITTDRGMEGVVIKPEVPVGVESETGVGVGVKAEAETSGVIPFMKVRNKEYLTLVYGYDYRFPHKYEKLIKQKSIKRKIKASLAEYKLGMEMLKVRLDEIGPENLQLKQTVANLLFEESQESEIDPRL